MNLDHILNKRNYGKIMLALFLILGIQLLFLQIQSMSSSDLKELDSKLKELDNEGLIVQNQKKPISDLITDTSIHVSSTSSKITSSSTNTNNGLSLTGISADNKPAVKYSLIEQLFKILGECKPNIDPLTSYINDERAAQKFSTDDDFYFSEKYLSGLLKLKESDIDELKLKHELFVSRMSILHMEVFGDLSKHKVEGNGVVIVGGGKFSWLALLNIHQLRAVGSKLPVEVYIPTEDEYEEEFCESVLPKLNARCTKGFKDLPIAKHPELEISGFQYKILSILVSSFQNVLLMDADNTAARNPDHLFKWKEFEEKSLVVWPDCWARTTNPSFYKISKIAVGNKPVRGIFQENKDPDMWNYHDLQGTLPNPSSESGMLLVDKLRQVDTLILSLYYNIYGPDYYYPLITQGGAGEGDKDTFLAAAYALNQPVYQVKQSMTFIGIHDDEGFHAKALGQWDPTTEKEVKGDEASDTEALLFLHMSYPKLYPDQLEGEIRRNNEDRVLYYGPKANSEYGFDLRMWELMAQLICKDYSKNENPNANGGSVELKEDDKLAGLKLRFVKEVEGDSYCDWLHLPHLEYLRNVAQFH